MAAEARQKESVCESEIAKRVPKLIIVPRQPMQQMFMPK